MSDLHLHIISFDIPYPANYGGVIDVFYKAKELAEKGVKVHLHSFKYGRRASVVLKKLFYEVNYYNRDLSKVNLIKSQPYIVSSRISEEMIQNLLKDDYPILMEGLHTSALLKEPRLDGRKRIVRTHNIEHEYYQNLAKVETDIFRKYYFFNEAAKLKRFEKVLKNADLILAISRHDEQYFLKYFNNVKFIPAFHPFKVVSCKPGKGSYVLYHGNLSVAENANAARFLLTEVFNDLDIPFKVAGLSPSKALISQFAQHPKIELIPNPSDKTLHDLIENAHINISITAQRTGLKLKLLNTLYNGRFCLVNDKMLNGSQLDDLCIIANNKSNIRRKIKTLFTEEFTEENIIDRKAKLGAIYNNGNNVAQLISLVG